jgi:dihydrolipoamide dehydrogenase
MPRRDHIYDYDLIIIGSGAGGGVAAHIAARAGRKVAIIEDDAVGGECPNFGCVPTKALLQAAEYYRGAQKAKRFGIKLSTLNFNYQTIKKWKDEAVRRTGVSEGDRAYAADGIAVIKSHAHFLSPYELSTGQRRLSAPKFLIATGTKNFIPPIEGLAETGYLTYRDAIDLTKPLKSVFVVGGGAIGCEFAELFASFGAKVSIAEFAPHLLPKEDAEVGELIAAVFEHNLGMQVHTATEVVSVHKKAGKKIVHFKQNGRVHTAKVDEILIATGKVANTDLGLENAGVKYDRRSIAVNEFMQTSAPHIFAAGDVAGPYMFTHMASYQSRIAAHNLFAKKSNWIKASYHAVPRCVFVTPEAASVGLTEEEIKAKGWKYKVGTAPVSVIGRANTTDEDVGFVKVLAAEPSGVLLGASIVSPRAGEMIHELTLAVQNRLKVQAVVDTIHAFPTWSEAVRIACAKVI